MSDGGEQQGDGAGPSGTGVGASHPPGPSAPHPVPTVDALNALAGSLASAMGPVLATAMEGFMDKLDTRLAARSGGGGDGLAYTAGQHPGISRGWGHGGHDAGSSDDPYSLGSR